MKVLDRAIGIKKRTIMLTTSGDGFQAQENESTRERVLGGKGY